MGETVKQNLDILRQIVKDFHPHLNCLLSNITLDSISDFNVKNNKGILH